MLQYIYFFCPSASLFCAALTKLPKNRCQIRDQWLSLPSVKHVRHGDNSCTFRVILSGILSQLVAKYWWFTSSYLRNLRIGGNHQPTVFFLKEHFHLGVPTLRGYDRQSNASQLSTARSSNGGPSCPSQVDPHFIGPKFC